MRTRSKLALIGLGATMLMAFAIGTASARNLSISNQNIRATFENLELGAEGISTTTCHVTLEGSLSSRTITKTPETLLGRVTRVTTSSCNAPVTILTATLPWHARYVGFSGRLPNITLLIFRTVGASFNIEPGLGFNCLAAANIDANLALNGSTGEVNNITIPLQNIPLRSGGGFGCPVREGFFRSNELKPGSVMLLGTTTRITIRLI